MGNQYSFVQKEIICSLDLNDEELNLKSIKNPKERKLITNNRNLLHKTIAARKFFLDIKNDKNNTISQKEVNELIHLFDGKEKLIQAARRHEKILHDLEQQQEIAKTAQKWQKQIAAEAVHQLKHDIKNVAYDPHKIKKYSKKAGIDSSEKESSMGSSKIYTFLGWLTSIRLFFVRFNRVLANYGLGFLPNFFNLFGLSYAFELVTDISMIAWSTFRPFRDEELELMQKENISKFKIYWWRFVNVVTKDERIPRMLNAAVWLAINLTCIILTGGMSTPFITPIVTLLVNKLNIGGYVFDVVNEIYKGIRDFFHHRSTRKQVNSEITELESKKQELNNELQKLYTLENKRNLNHIEKLRCQELEKNIKELTLQIKARELVKNKLDTKINYGVIANRVYNVLSVTALFVGMALIFFPPTTAIGACIFAGGLLALIGGSVLGGLGKRIWNKLHEGVTQHSTEPKDKTSYTTHCKLLFNNDCDLQFIKPNSTLPKKPTTATEKMLPKDTVNEQPSPARSVFSFFSRLFKSTPVPAPVSSNKAKLI